MLVVFLLGDMDNGVGRTGLTWDLRGETLIGESWGGIVVSLQSHLAGVAREERNTYLDA